MKVVYKYEYKYESVELPIGAKILKIGIQNDKFYIWAEIDTAADIEQDFLFT